MIQNSSYANYAKTFIDHTFLPSLDLGQARVGYFLNHSPLQYKIQTKAAVTFASFQEHYAAPEAQNERPYRILMPLYALKGVLRTIAHLFKAVMWTLFFSKNSALCNFYKVGRDLQEALGSVVRIFHDPAGAYLMEEARFYRDAYDQMGLEKRRPLLNLCDAQCRALLGDQVYESGDIPEDSVAAASNVVFKELALDKLSGLKDNELRLISQRLADLSSNDKEKIVGLSKLSAEEIQGKGEPLLSALLPLLSDEQIQGLDFTQLSNDQIQRIFIFGCSYLLKFSVPQYAKLFTVPNIPKEVFSQITAEEAAHVASLLDVKDIDRGSLFSRLQQSQGAKEAFFGALTLDQIQGYITHKGNEAAWLIEALSPEKINQYLKSANVGLEESLKKINLVQPMLMERQAGNRLAHKQQQTINQILEGVSVERQVLMVFALGLNSRSHFAEEVQVQVMQQLKPEQITQGFVNNLSSDHFQRLSVESQYRALSLKPGLASSVVKVNALVQMSLDSANNPVSKKSFVLHLLQNQQGDIAASIPKLPDALRLRVFALIGVIFAEYFLPQDRKAFVAAIPDDQLKAMLEEMDGDARLKLEVKQELRGYISPSQAEFLKKNMNVRWLGERGFEIEIVEDGGHNDINNN